MSYEQKDMTANLFPNDKGGNDRRPDYKGDAVVDGTLYKVSGWLKQGKRGEFLSLSFELPRSAADVPDKGPVGLKRSGYGAPPDDSSDIPFAPER